MSYPKGQTVRIKGTFTDANGALVDPSVVHAKYIDPDGQQTTLVYGVDNALVKDSTGLYHVDIVPAKDGKWRYRFESTGTLSTAGEEDFLVDASPFS